MMLYQLFSWLKGTSADVPILQPTIPRAFFESELLSALKYQRQLRGELHASRLDPSLLLSTKAAALRMAQHDEFLQFLSACEKALVGREQVPVFLVALNALLMQSNPSMHGEKITFIFSKSWIENKEETLRFYEQHHHQLAQFQPIMLLLSSEKMLENLLELTTHLRFQEHALAMIPLFQVFIEDTEHFAAAILWLFKRGVTIEQVLETDLLQRFMSYHLAWLGVSKNPLSQMYSLLATRPEGDGLVTAADQVKCEERGFHSYALTGVLREDAVLRHVPITTHAMVTTPTEDNFKALYRCFGLPFLTLALIQHVEHPHAVIQASFHHVLNQDGCDIPAFINQIASIGSRPALQMLSSLFEDETLEKLLVDHSGALLHLITFRPSLLSRIEESDVTKYIQHICLIHDQVFEVMSQLLALFNITREVHQTMATNVYEAILDVALTNSAFFEDRAFIKEMRKWSGKEAILSHRGQMLQLQFGQCVEEYVRAPGMMSERFHLIEDNWLQMSRQLALLREIMPLTAQMPEDKFKLYAHVAKAYFAAHPETFVLDDFISSLEITPTWLADGVGEYERVLIELLTILDDESIRHLIMGKFEILGAQKCRWMDADYGGETVFQRAAGLGNVGLIRWFDASGRMDERVVQEAIHLAADRHQWSVVDYFCTTSTHVLSQTHLKSLLVLAADDGQLSTVTLCVGAIRHLQEKHMVAAFLKAASKDHLSVVAYFCHLDPGAPSDEVLAKALKVAIQFHSLKIIAFMGDLPRRKALVSIAERALVHAATRDDLSMVQTLCALGTLAPSRSILHDALLKAAQFGHVSIVPFLCDLEAIVPCQKIVEEALALAIADGHLGMVHLLCSEVRSRPSQMAVERGFLQAVERRRVDVAQYLSSMEGLPVRQRTFNQALQLSAKRKDIAQVILLCHLATPHAIEKTFQMAAKLGQVEMMKHCFDTCPPPRATILWALQKAESNGAEAVAIYCRALLDRAQASAMSLRPGLHIDLPRSLVKATPSAIPPHIRVSPYVLTTRESRPSSDNASLRKTVSCGALTKLGLFKLGGRRPDLEREGRVQLSHKSIGAVPHPS